jgi:SAM-dependent methyltransferase
MIDSNATLAEGLDKRFSSAEGLYGRFEDLPLVTQKGHYRRMAILEALPLGDLRDKVCVDFGTGSWGFAAIYPRLHDCRFAYGLDISNAALERAAEVSRQGQFPYQDRFQYLQSDGMDLPLPDGSVDLIFAGEAIEHMRLPQRFLSECHRILRPGGQLILTTPNRDALLYRMHGDQYCVSPEHFWLFNAEELHETVSEFFSVQECIGFNGSIYRDLDKSANEVRPAEEWAALFADRPEFSTGLIMRAVKANDQPVRRFQIQPISRTSVLCNGQPQMLELDFGLKGMMINDPAVAFRFECPPCSGLVLYFWRHDWSGICSIHCGGEVVEQDLYSRDAGWKNVHCQFAEPASRTIEIRPTGKKDARSPGTEAIFFEAFTYSE